MIAKGLASSADAVFLDLEDGVAPDRKAEARKLVIDALTGSDWHGKARTVRINALDTPWCYRDLIDIVEQAGDHLDAIVAPKIEQPGDVIAMARLLDQVELAIGRQSPVAIDVQIETPTASAMVTIASSVRREVRLKRLVHRARLRGGEIDNVMAEFRTVGERYGRAK